MNFFTKIPEYFLSHLRFFFSQVKKGHHNAVIITKVMGMIILNDSTFFYSLPSRDSTFVDFANSAFSSFF